MVERVKGALEGIRVAEWGPGRMVAYAGKLLRDYGADVILLEEEPGQRGRILGVGSDGEGARQREVLMRFFYGGKRSVAVDISQKREREAFLELLADTDVLLMQQDLRRVEPWGLHPEGIASVHPQLVVVSASLAGLTATGRYLPHAEIVAQAMSGIAGHTPIYRQPGDTPLKIGGYQADYTTGLMVASSALLGLQLRRRSGRGHVMDVSSQATLASFMRHALEFRTYNHELPEVSRPQTFTGLVPCKDGYFAFQASEQYQWDGLRRMLGSPEWAMASEFASPADAHLNWDKFEPGFLEWARDRTKTEIFHAAQAQRVPLFPCYDVSELLDDPQQLARGFFVEVPAPNAGGLQVRMPGALVCLDRTPWRPGGTPPAFGEHTADPLKSQHREAAS